VKLVIVTATLRRTYPNTYNHNMQCAEGAQAETQGAPSC